MAARFPEPTEAETVVLLEKAIPESTKKATKNGYKVHKRTFAKTKKYFK